MKVILCYQEFPPSGDVVKLAKEEVIMQNHRGTAPKSASHVPGLVAGLAPPPATIPFKYSKGTLGTFGLTPDPVAFGWPPERALILAISRILSFSF
jgi:hypothetical protein